MAKETTYEEIARELKNRIYKPVYYLMGEEVLLYRPDI